MEQEPSPGSANELVRCVLCVHSWEFVDVVNRYWTGMTEGL